MTTITHPPAYEGKSHRLDPLLTAARMLLWILLVGVIIALIVSASGDLNGYEIGLDLSPAGIAFALLLFILARVFRHGTALRADLDGMV